MRVQVRDAHDDPGPCAGYAGLSHRGEVDPSHQFVYDTVSLVPSHAYPEPPRLLRPINTSQIANLGRTKPVSAGLVMEARWAVLLQHRLKDPTYRLASANVRAPASPMRPYRWPLPL
jgi:hypothetical protein